MKHPTKPRKRKIKKDDIILEDYSNFGDPNCLHCAILDAMAKFAATHSEDGALEIGEILNALLHVIVQTIKDDKIAGEDQIKFQDGILDILHRNGIHWMRIEGTKQ